MRLYSSHVFSSLSFHTRTFGSKILAEVSVKMKFLEWQSRWLKEDRI